MKKILAGVVIGIALPFVAGYLFVISGRMPVATKGPPLPFEKFLARKAQHAVMDPEAGKPAPPEKTALKNSSLTIQVPSQGLVLITIGNQKVAR